MKTVTIYNRTFFDFGDKARLMADIERRYRYCHYDIEGAGSIGHKGRQDNLYNLSVGNKTRDKLLEIMPIKEGDTVLELGAYRGYGTLWLSERVGSKGKVIAVEADRDNYEILKANMALNNVGNVYAINKGITDKRGDGYLYIRDYQRKSLVPGLLKVDDKKLIEVDTIDGILEDLKIKPDVITMEINNAEVLALKGAKETLKSNKLRIVTAGWYSWEGEPARIAIADILHEYNFEVYIGVANKVYAYREG